VVCQLRGAGQVTLNSTGHTGSLVILTTEEARFCDDPTPPAIDMSQGNSRIEFRRPGAVLVRLR
jgi:hypothetical protein